jgi:hypothetical protein
MIEAEGTGPDGRFASAKAVFIEMKPEHFIMPENDSPENDSPEWEQISD